MRPASESCCSNVVTITITTLAIGIAALFLALFLILTLAATVTIPPAAFREQVSASPTVGEYARLAWFAASVATEGGALGSLVKSDQAVPDAAYRPRGGRQEAMPSVRRAAET